MDALFSPAARVEDELTDSNWPASLEATREQLKKAEVRLERYRAALRLAGAEIDQRNRGIIALTTFAFQASRSASLATLLKLALVQALETTGAPLGAIVLIDAETKALTLGVHKDLTPELAQILTGYELGRGATALMPHLVTGAGALLEYNSSEDETERLLLDSGRLTSLVSLPLQVGSRLLGAFLVGLRDDRYFKPAELCFVMALSQETATALESLRLRDGVWHTAEVFLGGEITDETLAEETTQAEWSLKIPTPFDMPAETEQNTEPAEDDLEQLLAAMMDAEDEVQQQNADLQHLNSISAMLNNSLNLKEILQCAVDQTQSLLQTDAAWIYLVDDQAGLEMEAHTGLSSTYVRGMHRLHVGSGLEGEVAANHQARFVESIADDDHAHKIWVDKEQLQAVAAVPITRPKNREQPGSGSSEVVGVLAAARRAGAAHPWSPREMRLLTSVANQLALAIDNARLYAQVQDKEVSMRTGNEVLRTINDMLLEKNAFLEGFVQEDLVPMLTEASDIMQRALGEKQPEIPAGCESSQEMARLRQIIDRLNDLTRQTDNVSKVLDTEFNRVLAERRQPETSTDPAPQEQVRPIRLEKKHPASSPAPQAPPPAPARQQDPDATKELKPLSFEEAVAAGLVPAHLLNKEINRSSPSSS